MLLGKLKRAGMTGALRSVAEIHLRAAGVSAEGPDRTWPRLVLLTTAVAFALTGVSFLVAPLPAVGMFGLVADTTRGADGATEVRAFYGGLELGFALWLGTAAATPAGLSAAVHVLAGCGICRLVAAATATAAAAPPPPEAPNAWLHIAVAIAELFGAGVAGAALHAARKQVERRDGDVGGDGDRAATPSSAGLPAGSALAQIAPFSPAVLQDPYPFYAALRAEAPVYKMPGADYYVISRYQDIVAACKDTDSLSSNIVAILLSKGDGKTAMLNKPELDVGPVDVLALADPPIHRPQRRAAFSGLTPKLFASLEDEIRSLTCTMVDDILRRGEGGQVVDWMERFALRLPMMVALDLCGFPRDEHRQVKEWADHGVALLSGVNTPAAFAEHTAQAIELLHWTRQQYNAAVERYDDEEAAAGGRGAAAVASVASSRVDLTTKLIEATRRPAGHRDGSLSDEEAVSMIFQVLLAGNDSSASTLGSAVHRLAVDGATQTRLRAAALAVAAPRRGAEVLGPGAPALTGKARPEPCKDIAAFIEEVLRMESPFGGHFRRVKRDGGLTLHGVHMPKGARVMLLWASGNRDPSQFPQPDTWAVGRANASSHLAFGNGIHACLGQKLARLEVRVALEELLRRTGFNQSFSASPDTASASASASASGEAGSGFLKGFRLACSPGVLRFVPSVFVRSLEALPVRFDGSSPAGGGGGAGPPNGEHSPQGVHAVAPEGGGGGGADVVKLRGAGGAAAPGCPMAGVWGGEKKKEQ